MKMMVMAVVAGFVFVSAGGSGFSYTFDGGKRAGTESPGFAIVGGRLLHDEEPVLKGFSVKQTELSYLFFYLPEIGLLTVAGEEFPGSAPAGRFEDGRLAFELEGQRFALEWGRSVTSGEAPEAWAALDESYSLGIDAPLFGYGDSLDVPESWKGNVGRRDQD
jgi:hypothetical protein